MDVLDNMKQCDACGEDFEESKLKEIKFYGETQRLCGKCSTK